ncbi:GerAB/ArcD/ProY family transporter [Paenibacillus piri]|uniref:Spore gernimation protein n=1 Tax=Paenibacillus piri TaxID=2547395 RepID=A0A4R5KPG6_9BACL|nr:endospore germination permease [Paenibacillus piri]TDF97603.1 spore gernimation protein [Paenibacillus piri]
MTIRINILQASMILLTSVGLMNHVILIPILLDIAERDAWFSALLTLVPYLLWTGLLYWIVKRSGQQPLFQWVESVSGKAVAAVLKLVFGVIVLLVALITLKDTITWAIASYLPETPAIALALLLVSICYFAAQSGILCISVMSGILFPVIVILGYFVMSANIINKDYSRLLPVMEYGLSPLLQGMYYVGAGYGELILLLLMQEHIVTRIKWWHLALLGIIIAGLTIGPITGSIAEFGPVESAKHRYPAFEQWKLVKIQQSIERVDFFSIYQWFAGAFVRISMSMYILCELSPFKGKRSKTVSLIVLALLMPVVILLPVSDIQFYDWLKYVYMPSALIAYVVLTLCLCTIALFAKKGAYLRENME